MSAVIPAIVHAPMKNTGVHTAETTHLAIRDTRWGLDRSHEAAKSLLVLEEGTVGACDTLPRFVHPSTSRKGYPEPVASAQNRKEGHMGGDTTTWEGRGAIPWI